MRKASLLALVWALTSVSTVRAQPPAAPPESSDTHREVGVSVPPLSELLRQWRAETQPERRLALVPSLALAPEGVAALLSLLPNEPAAAVRQLIVDQVSLVPDPRVAQALERQAATDPDPHLALRVLEKLHLRRARELLAVARRRRASAAAAGPSEDLPLWTDAEERWIAASLGAVVPGFLRQPPPPFSVPVRRAGVRVLAFGDYGTGSENQKKTAAAMRAYHRKKRFDFGITLGDNFYPAGLSSPSHPHWEPRWKALYEPLRIPIFVSLGNHDWNAADSVAAEAFYAVASRSWRLPATRYTFTAGPVQFFVLDTTAFSEAQALWLKDELERSRARWKIVYGHHPIYSHGGHGGSKVLIERLLPILQGRADAYFAGHEHDMQHLRPEGGVHFFIAGGGGAKLRPIQPGPRSLYAGSHHGFAVLEANARQLEITFVGTEGQTLYQHTLSPTVTVAPGRRY